jgi:hypothetical protein
MSSIATPSRIPRLFERFVWWVLLAVPLSPGFSAWAAEPLLPKPNGSELPSATSARPSVAVPAPQVYFLKIAYLFKDGKRSEDETDQFSTFLDRRQSWRSTIEQTQEGFLPLRQECEKGKLYCDVIKIEEEITDGEMTMNVMIFTTPPAHRKVHGGAENQSAIPPCRLKDFNEKVCRETLMRMVIGELAGIDKNHPLSSPGR